MKIRLLSLLLSGLSFLAGFAAESPPAKQIHHTRGLIREIAKDGRKAVIRHEAIPGYMPAMTMELTVRDPKELAAVKVGDIITFRILANDDTHWIDTVRRVEAPVPATAAPTSRQAALSIGRQLRTGDDMPDVRLQDEHGQPRALSSFRGQALAFTFIFTRCPLPDYCPRMNRNFATARGLLRADPSAPKNWSFLSVSFDAEYDQPAVLSRYATGYRGDDSAGWLFAAADGATLSQLAPRLNLIVNQEGGSFAHNLRTVVLDTRGRIHRQFDGNEWTADQLAAAIREAAAVPSDTAGKP